MNFCANCGVNPTLFNPNSSKFWSMSDRLFESSALTVGEAMSSMYGPNMGTFLNGVPGDLFYVCTSCCDDIRKAYIPWKKVMVQAKWPGIFTGLFASMSESLAHFKEDIVVPDDVAPVGNPLIVVGGSELNSMDECEQVNVDVDMLGDEVKCENVNVDHVVEEPTMYSTVSDYVASFEEITSVSVSSRPASSCGSTFTLSTFPSSENENLQVQDFSGYSSVLVDGTSETYVYVRTSQLNSLKSCSVNMRLSNSFFNSDETNKSNNASHSSSKGKYPCPHCSTSNNYVSTLIKHLQSKHLGKQRKPIKGKKGSGSEPQKTRISCCICTVTSSCNATYIAHLQSRHSARVVRFLCKICDFPFKSVDYRNFHYKNVHKLSYNEECFTCKAKFYFEEDLNLHGSGRNHIVSGGESQPPKAPQRHVISNVTPSSSKSTSKSKAKAKKRSPICPTCRNYFSTMPVLKSHLKNVHKLDGDELISVWETAKAMFSPSPNEPVRSNAAPTTPIASTSRDHDSNSNNNAHSGVSHPNDIDIKDEELTADHKLTELNNLVASLPAI